MIADAPHAIRTPSPGRETRRLDGCAAVGVTVSRVHRPGVTVSSVGDADAEWIPALRLLISASERRIQALVACISRRHAGIHPASAVDAESDGGGVPVETLRRWRAACAQSSVAGVGRRSA